MKILAFPKDANPYQELLYAPMRDRGAIVRYLEGPTSSHSLNLCLLPWQLIALRVQGFRVLHLHWTFPFALPWLGRIGRWLMQAYFHMFIWEVKLLGYRLVWTTHNILPHEPLFANDRMAHWALGNAADGLIVQTSAVHEQLLAIGVTNPTISRIPHGSYVGTYPDTATSAAARKQLHLPTERTVILFFGHIRPYKGIETLLDAWQRLPKKHNLTLVIAGKVHGSQLQQRIEQATAQDRTIRAHLGHVADADLQYYFRAADFAIVPYDHATTSGIALLACSFACPLITPKHNAFADIPSQARIAYTAGHLRDTLIAADAMPPETRHALSTHARSYADDLSWPAIATRTLAFLENKQ